MCIAGMNVNKQENGNLNVKPSGVQQLIPEDSSGTGSTLYCMIHRVVLPQFGPNFTPTTEKCP